MKKKLILGLSFLLSIGIARSQVTIGSLTPPVEGALLDLREGAVTDDVTATKGMMLPRVKLSDLNKLKMGDNDLATEEYAKHTGLVVYHVSGEAKPLCADIVDGVYVWSGTRWLAFNDQTIKAALTLKDGTVTLSDGQVIDIASGNDERGTTIPNLSLKAEWTGNELKLTPTGKTGGDYSPFDPMISSSDPTLTSGTDVPITAKPGSVIISFADMSDVIQADNPWVSREWALKFKVEDICGTEIEQTVTLNQTNYALGINQEFADYSLTLSSTNNQSLAVKANTTWKATIGGETSILTVVSGTDAGGTINSQGETSSKYFQFKPQEVAGMKYKKATVKFEDTQSPKRAKDITITMTSCLGTPDVSGLQTEANSNNPDWETDWGTKVIRHLAKANPAKPGENIYEEFLSADFGTAGRWMNTNLSAWSYDSIQHSQASSSTPRTLQQHDGRSIIDDSVAFWTYPGKRTIQAGESATSEYTANPYLGLLYTWDAATAGKGGDTGMKNIYNTDGSTVRNDESGFLEGTGVGQQKRIQGICPLGWHLPSDAEYTDLENEIKRNTATYSTLPDIGGDDTPYGSASPATEPIGQAMKDVCEKGTNNSKNPSDGGFALLLAGHVAGGSTALQTNFISELWTASSYNAIINYYSYAHGRYSYSTSSNVGILKTNSNKMLSVRCKKD